MTDSWFPNQLRADPHEAPLFSFEGGAITLGTGEVFSPRSQAADRWVSLIDSMYRAAGSTAEILYQTADDQFIFVVASIGPRDWYFEQVQQAKVIRQSEARVWLQRNNFMLPNCLMKGVKTFPTVPKSEPVEDVPPPMRPKSATAAQDADATPTGTVNVGNWHEGASAFAQAFSATQAAKGKLDEGGKEDPQPEPKKAARRGRPADTDPKADQRIYDAWKTGQHKTYADLAKALGIQERDVRLAIDRHDWRVKNGRI